MDAHFNKMLKQQVRVNGFRFATEARLVRAGVFAGVFHVLAFDDNELFVPPIVVYAAGKWKTEAEAHRAAREYASIMANDGALREAVALRQTAFR